MIFFLEMYRLGNSGDLVLRGQSVSIKLWQKQEVAAANHRSVDAALVALLSELDDIFSLK